MSTSKIPATGSNRVMSLTSRLLAGTVLPLIDRSLAESVLPFRTPDMMRPNVRSKRYGWTHYGVFLPGLPAPFKYCNIMTLLGTTGAVIFDNDYLITGNPRDTATFLSSTAASDPHHYRAYSIRNECRTRDDGSLIAFGDNLTISGTYPHYQVTAAYDDFLLDIRVDCTDQVSWFQRNVIYDHLSLLARCTGSISQGGQTIAIDTLGTFDYARCASPHVLTRRVIPEGWKLPADFFNYQIINLDDSTQLLLTDVRSLGLTGFKGMHVRTLGGSTEVHAEDADFQVQEYLADPAIAPDGRSMRLPRRFSWRVRASDGTTLLDIRCQIDSPWRYGHGRGYVSCYRFEGEFRGQRHEGMGYIEYIDCETV